MNTCPSCQSTARQVKNGQTASGSQRYWCRGCGRKYTPAAKGRGYPAEVRAQAARLYVDGGSLRWIARHLGVVHQTVAHWVSAQADALPAAPPQPASVATAEREELVTFVAHKKTTPTSSRR
jgi:transposase-like protein